MIIDLILATERLRSAGALTVALVATVPLMVITIGCLETASANTQIAIVPLACTLLAAGWTTFALRFVVWSPACRLEPFLRRRGFRVISDVDADLRATTTRRVYGNWPRSVLYPPPDFVALGAKWLIQMRLGHAALVYLPELVWVHERVVPKLIWGVGDRYRVELAGRLRDGSTVSIRLDDEAELGELLEELLERRPALLTGWRGEWLELREAGPAAVAAAYAARDREFDSLPPEKREVWLDESFDLFQRFVENIP
jgi:hypothetical protein